MMVESKGLLVSD